MSNKRVFVAGGAGFVGSAVVRELLDADADVVSYDNYLHGDPENLLGLPAKLKIVAGDARDVDSLRSAVRDANPDYIINCIGDTYVPTAYYVPERFFDINVNCTLNVLRVARDCAIGRVVYVSSTEVYGASSAHSLTEDHPLNPLNTYAVSKAAADRLCHTFHLEHGVPVVIARIFNCYGPRESHPYVIPEIVAQFARSHTVCLGNLHAERDFTYVADTARALIGLLAPDVRDGDVFNVGSGLTFSVEWLAHAIAREMGIDNPQIRSQRDRLRRCDIECFRCDNSKLRMLTGWAPQVGMLDGLRHTVGWYIAGGRRWSWERRANDVIYGEAAEATLA
jgi:nucleoside-diphosphate-sugar epimerase